MVRNPVASLCNSRSGPKTCNISDDVLKAKLGIFWRISMWTV